MSGHLGSPSALVSHRQPTQKVLLTHDTLFRYDWRLWCHAFNVPSRTVPVLHEALFGSLLPFEPTTTQLVIEEQPMASNCV